MIYESADYKKILVQALTDKKTHVSKQFTFQNMAEHCGVQKTYLSKVLNREGHLTEDQLYLACDYLGFSEDETNYVALVYAHEKSIVPKRREILKKKIESFQNQNRKTEKRIAVTAVEDSSPHIMTYHLDPYFPLIHVFLTIRKYASDVRRISEALAISESQLNYYLTRLEQMGIVRFQAQRFEVLKDNIHLPQDSALYTAFRTRMRIKALEKMDRSPAAESYSFSVVFSSIPQVRQKIQTLILNTIKESQELVSKGKEEEIYQMNIDLLNWS
jgi:hypothetical protein